ncbi:hypothetical protein EVAR_66336_1 [Eumeta japonica]|uniref:Uncharacterized protein n=1 Tax=Eumeta variegata TaxID=151549 RepID=A0A4C1Z2N0_EUMVA|nr:hypothetical protein EVAR_66336_1 [Eumeta japonica]
MDCNSYGGAAGREDAAALPPAPPEAGRDAEPEPHERRFRPIEYSRRLDVGSYGARTLHRCARLHAYETRGRREGPADETGRGEERATGTHSLDETNGGSSYSVSVFSENVDIIGRVIASKLAKLQPTIGRPVCVSLLLQDGFATVAIFGYCGGGEDLFDWNSCPSSGGLV